MSLAADVAVGAAERLERTAGPGPGLKVWRRLAANAASAELRGRAILGGLRCAIAVRDLGAIRDLAQLWRTVEMVDPALWDGVFATCKDMWRSGLGVCATDLACSEVKRAPTTRALYAYARCLDVAGDPKATAAFADALASAEREGATRYVRVCRIRHAAWLARSAATLSAGIEEAKRVVVADAPPAERLVLARVLLRSPSRFARASAIGMLDDVVIAAANASAANPGVMALARRALGLAARHADDMNDELTPLEVDRLTALFSREPFGKPLARVRDVVRAIDRLARANEKKSDTEMEAALADAARVDPELAILHHRARDILGGRFEAHQPDEPATTSSTSSTSATSAHPQWTALLDAVVAMRDEAWPRAAHALRRLAELAERGQRVPPHVWSTAQAALGAGDAEVRAVAGRLVAAMMKTTTAAPPRGWLALAQALAVVGMDDLATTARRAAAVAKEPGAADALALTLTRSGWQHALAGDRSQALERLREAKALSPASAPAAPTSAPAATPPADDASRAPPAPPRDPASTPST
jgi:hypothetical protein